MAHVPADDFEDRAGEASPRRQHRGERRIDSLLEAAEAVFAEIGYDRATTNLIAERASASPGTLYQFFPNKQAIAEALARRYAGRLSEMFHRSFGADRVHAPLPVLVDSLVAYFLSFHLKAPAFHNLLLASAISPELRQRLHSFLDVAVERLATLLEARMPSLPKDDTLLVARVCVSIWQCIVPLSMGAPDEKQRARVIEEMKAVFQRYLGPLGGP